MNTQLISRYLTYLRKSKNWTQEDMAIQLKISRQAVSKWETGVSLPDLDMLLRISKIYNITINEILEPQIELSISQFEDINGIDKEKLKEMLSFFDTTDIVKASMGASPKTDILLQQLYPDVNFMKERNSIGNVRIEEIEDIHTQIVSMINMEL